VRREACDEKRVTKNACEREGPDQTLHFGRFVLLQNERRLLEGGQELRIGDRALEILMLLVRKAGQVVTKEELIAHAWPNTVVEATNLRVNIATLRRVLRDGTPPNRFIVNVVGQGYVFVAEIRVEDGSDSSEVALALEAPRQRHLPAPLNRLIGRNADVGSLTAIVRVHRLVTIVGAGGVGKTVVAIEVASRLREYFTHGAYFVDLSTIGEAALIADSFGAALRLAVSRQNSVGDLIAYLREKEMLLVIDNCEHLIEAAAGLIDCILKGTTRTHVLATSREPLSAHDEYHYRLASLDFPLPRDSMTAALAKQYSAVQLFELQASAGTRAFELTDSNASAVSQICHQLDGNPLAIELAAARVSLLGVHELATRLKDRFLSITNGRRTAVARHHTLRATLDWSYALLGATAQIVLQRLAIFHGTFTAEAAATVAARRGLSVREAQTAVTSLAVKSLLMADTSVDPSRHRLLYTTRLYALEKLSKSKDGSAASRWHCEYVQKLLRQAEAEWDRTSRLQWVNKFAFAVDDIRAAIDWAFSATGDPVLGADLTVAAVPFGFQLGLMDEFRERVEHALRCLDQLPNRQPIISTRLRSALATMSLNPPNEQHRIKIVDANQSSEMRIRL
jgi:predicted ATPase/DNA-binding winged helix-turn-helix (wHTH) protein